MERKSEGCHGNSRINVILTKNTNSAPCVGGLGFLLSVSSQVGDKYVCHHNLDVYNHLLFGDVEAQCPYDNYC